MVIDKTKYIGKFYGWLQIKDVTGYVESSNVIVLFEEEGQDTLEISPELLDKYITTDKVEPTEFRDRVIMPVVEQLTEVLLKNQVRVEWIEYAFNAAAHALNASLDKATEIKWGKKLYNRTVLDVDNTLTNNK